MWENLELLMPNGFGILSKSKIGTKHQSTMLAGILEGEKPNSVAHY